MESSEFRLVDDNDDCLTIQVVEEEEEDLIVDLDSSIKPEEDRRDAERSSSSSIDKKEEEADSNATLIDSIIDYLPIELHAPGYQFCGPGTHLTERLERGEKGINALDSFCREHDLSYSQSNCSRSQADRLLAKRAFSRLLSETADTNEKTIALITTCCMISKIYFHKIHSGIKKLKKKLKKKFKRL